MIKNNKTSNNKITTKEKIDTMAKSKYYNEAKKNSFEILLAENIKIGERVKHKLPNKGLVVKEKVTQSPPQVKYHILDKGGIVKLMKEIERDEA